MMIRFIKQFLVDEYGDEISAGRFWGWEKKYDSEMHWISNPYFRLNSYDVWVLVNRILNEIG